VGLAAPPRASPITYRDDKPVTIRSRILDITKAMKLLGWKPSGPPGRHHQHGGLVAGKQEAMEEMSIKTKKHDAIVLSSGLEKNAQARLGQLLKHTPLPPEEILDNLGVYLTSKTLSRLLFFYEIYRKVVGIHGVIVEFGVRWGQTLSLLSALRGIFEPFNRHRKIIGFDTFEGFRGSAPKMAAASNVATALFPFQKNMRNTWPRFSASRKR
jgi:hypothetical protein